jgi:precorrin-6A/cobalt-precorrin-6A reductase
MARILILGGTAEAAELAARLAGDDRLETVTSLAGLTRLPNIGAGRVRRGGFGGPDGLAAFLTAERYDALIDATHPFAAQIAAHAAEAATKAGVPRVKLVRPPFERTPDDRFIPVPDMKAAAAALPVGARTFLAAGRREIAEFILVRPPADPEAEIALLQKHRIGWIVSKDSGGQAAAKIRAARRLKIPVVLVERPSPPPGPIVETVDAVLAWIEATLFRKD